MKRTGVGLYSLVILGWILVIVASCGTQDEKSKGAKNAADTAAVPAVRSVEILPENPSKNSMLETVVTFDQSETADVRYRWMKNGKEILGETERTLKQDNFQKGDTIAVEVIPYVKTMQGPPLQSKPVVIVNSPPVLRSFSIEPLPAYSTNELKALLDVFDADGEHVRTSFQWKKDKKDIPGATASTLSPDYFKKGDRIGCQARVSDGESPEVSYYSNETVILNSAPLITSKPSAEVIEGSLYEYAVTAEDPDEDEVTFSLVLPPEGMTIDTVTGIIRWQVSEQQKEGRYDFEVIARDSEGAQSVQPITLTLTSEREGGQKEEGD